MRIDRDTHTIQQLRWMGVGVSVTIYVALAENNLTT